jgi:hypothetical protein
MVFCVFYSCTNTNKDEELKKEIVGVYSYSEILEEEEEGVSIITSVNGTSTFNSDGSCEDNGILVITYIDEEGYQTNLKYRLEAFGKYDIQKSYIISDYDLNNIRITLLETDDYEMSNLFNEHYIPQWKHDMIVDNKEKIIELNEKYLKTEYEIDGEKETNTYIRQSKQADKNQSQPTQNNLITSTSIAGIEFIGKTLNEVRPYLNNTLTWERSEFEDSEYYVKNGETMILSVYIYDRKINAVAIYEPSLVTKDGLHVGNTSGDILKIYPNATVRNAEFGEYSEFKDIIYVYDSTWENRVGDYLDNDISIIVNPNIRIQYIIIGYFLY